MLTLDVEYYENHILEVLYKGFIRDPPYRIKNSDLEKTFGKIKNTTNFKIAREKLIQEGLIYGKNVNFGNPHFFQIIGEGLIYYEKKYVISDDKSEYTELILKVLMFLRDLGDKKYDISKYVERIENRNKKAIIPRIYFNKILITDFNYEMNDLKWLILYFTSHFVSKHFMEINGIGISKDNLTFHNPDKFCINLEGYNFINDIFLNDKSQNLEYNNKIKFIRFLLDLKECEFLDFKLAIYDLFSDNLRSKWEQRKEFLKDVLSLINNKSYDNNTGKAYIIIGVGEKNGRYNGTHRNIEFVQYETLIQLINEHITPKMNTKFEEYYIYGGKANMIISKSKKEGYDRNFIIILTYVIGTVYEIKKEIGNPNINVSYYHEGTSFTRDDSHIRRLTQEDREQIMVLFDEILTDEFELENYEMDSKSEDIVKKTSAIKIDTELIKNYTKMLNTKKISLTSAEKILHRIKNQTRLLSYYKTIDDNEIKILIEFVKFSCKFIQDKNKQLNNLIFLI